MSDDTVTRISTAKRPALGRGLGALLGETRREEPLVTPARAQSGSGEGKAFGLAMLAVADIVPHPDQPRRQFSEEALAELAASISARGFLVSIASCNAAFAPFMAMMKSGKKK